MSAYVVVAFTIQRLYIVFKPLAVKYKSKKSAWQTILFILIISITINLWVPFVFELQANENHSDNIHYCDIDAAYKKIYFYLNIIYICLIMLLPMIIILICNVCIIFKLNSKKRKELQNRSRSKRNNVCLNDAISAKMNNREASMKTEINKLNLIRKSTHSTTALNNVENLRLKPHYWTFEQKINRNKNNLLKATTKLTVMLLVISFSFISLNAPYLTGWLIFFYKQAFHQLDNLTRNYLVSFLQISEIFYIHILNYGMKFFIFCASGTVFRNKLKNLSNYITFFIIIFCIKSLILIFFNFKRIYIKIKKIRFKIESCFILH